MPQSPISYRSRRRLSAQVALYIYIFLPPRWGFLLSCGIIEYRSLMGNEGWKDWKVKPDRASLLTLPDPNPSPNPSPSPSPNPNPNPNPNPGQPRRSQPH